MKRLILYLFLFWGGMNAATAQSIATSPASTTACSGQMATFTVLATNAATYQWQTLANGTWNDLSDAGIYSGSATGQLSISDVTGMDSFSYRCVVEDSLAGYDTSAAASLYVAPLPSSVIAVIGASTICEGDSVLLSGPAAPGLSYSWDLNAATLPETSSGVYASSSGVYSLTTTDLATGCSSAATSETVLVNPLPVVSASIAGASVKCLGDSVMLRAGYDASFTYQWQLNGIDAAGANDTVFYAAASGDYSVRVTDGNNCWLTVPAGTATIRALPTAVITYSTPLSFCEGGAVVLTADTSGGLVNFQWLVDGVPDAANTVSNNLVSQSGAYSVTVSDSYGCSGTSSQLPVAVHPLPQPAIALTGTEMSTGSYLSYQWFQDNAVISGATNASYTATANGSYTVEVSDSNGCVARAGSISINSLAVASALGVRSRMIFPNPTTGLLKIANGDKQNVTVQSAEGRTLLQRTDVSEIDLSSFANGMYVVTVSAENGTRLATERVILNR